jgi:ribosomal protein S18 acetylase RimI-like enzyme
MTSEEPGRLDTDDVLVRTLEEKDLEAIVRIDAAAVGRRRQEYYQDRVKAALSDSRIHTSLVAELAPPGQETTAVVGFLMSTNYYGEFGRPEPTAVIEALGVLPELRGQHVGEALMRQFVMNARALRVDRIRTEVAWNDHGLLRFFDKNGFTPSSRLVLERTLEE